MIPIYRGLGSKLRALFTFENFIFILSSEKWDFWFLIIWLFDLNMTWLLGYERPNGERLGTVSFEMSLLESCHETYFWLKFEIKWFLAIEDGENIQVQLVCKISKSTIFRGHEIDDVRIRMIPYYRGLGSKLGALFTFENFIFILSSD